MNPEGTTISNNPPMSDKYVIVEGWPCNQECLTAFQLHINKCYDYGYRAEGGLTIQPSINGQPSKYIQVMVKNDPST